METYHSLNTVVTLEFLTNKQEMQNCNCLF